MVSGHFVRACVRRFLNDFSLMFLFVLCILWEGVPPCQDSCRLELKNFRGPETTKMNTYSPERKAALIARMMPPHNQSVVQLA
ncbi:hypothetical protein, partial [Serratia ficaria]|uniref:hypothetical protein n=1 Tax=Serratia ficaria TaxID=61651 RepID=UPI0021C6F480